MTKEQAVSVKSVIRDSAVSIVSAVVVSFIGAALSLWTAHRLVEWRLAAVEAAVAKIEQRQEDFSEQLQARLDRMAADITYIRERLAKQEARP